VSCGFLRDNDERTWGDFIKDLIEMTYFDEIPHFHELRVTVRDIEIQADESDRLSAVFKAYGINDKDTLNLEVQIEENIG